MPDNPYLTAKYSSEDERQAAIERGETTPRLSTVGDGARHYAVVRIYEDGDFKVAENLTNTDRDTYPDAVREAERLDHGPFADGVAGYDAWRIA